MLWLVCECVLEYFLTRLCHLMQSDHGVRGLLVTEKQSIYDVECFPALQSRVHLFLCMFHANGGVLRPRDLCIWSKTNKLFTALWVSAITVMDMDSHVIAWRGYVVMDLLQWVFAADNAAVAVACHGQSEDQHRFLSDGREIRQLGAQISKQNQVIL